MGISDVKEDLWNTRISRISLKSVVERPLPGVINLCFIFLLCYYRFLLSVRGKGRWRAFTNNDNSWRSPHLALHERNSNAARREHKSGEQKDLCCRYTQVKNIVFIPKRKSLHFTQFRFSDLDLYLMTLLFKIDPDMINIYHPSKIKFICVTEQMFVTRLPVISAHQILALVTNMRCSDFTALAD